MTPAEREFIEDTYGMRHCTCPRCHRTWYEDGESEPYCPHCGYTEPDFDPEDEAMEEDERDGR